LASDSEALTIFLLDKSQQNIIFVIILIQTSL
jgi:hypothetical protein